MSFILNDNTRQVLDALERAKERALQRMGMEAEGFAVDLAPEDTGNLKNSITHKVDEGADKVYIGTNVEYAGYVELGTGIYSEIGGRPTPWVYQDDKGEWHHTRGQKPKPFLRPAVKDHKGTYVNILADELKNA